jgi:hypothetical protein
VRLSRSYRLIYTSYAGSRSFVRDEVSDTLGRFVKICDSFAHQDTSSTIFTKQQAMSSRSITVYRSGWGTIQRRPKRMRICCHIPRLVWTGAKCNSSTGRMCSGSEV